MGERPKVAITLQEQGRNGGPYISHTRLMNSELRNRYEFIPLMVPPPPRLRRFTEMLGFVRTIRAIQPDILHFSGLQLEGFLVSIAGVLAGVRRSVVAIHGSSLEATYFPAHKKAVLGVLEAMTLRLSTACYGVSDYVTNWTSVKRNARCPCERIYNLPHLPAPDAVGRSARHELGIPDDAVVVISTGRIVRDKGFHELPAVVQHLSSNEGVWLIVAGEGDYLPELQERLARGPLGQRAICLGFRADIPLLLAASDIFILLTQHETFGMSVVEAMAESIPVVVTNVGGLPEVVTHGHDGFLVEPGDSIGASQILDRLIADKSLRARMGRHARGTVDRRFGEIEIVDQVDRIYRRLLGSGRE